MEAFEIISPPIYRAEPEPFDSASLPCESCGNPVACERKTASWEPSLLVGPCCEFTLDIPEMDSAPICPSLWPALDRCRSVQEVSLAIEMHLRECPICQQARKAIVSTACGPGAGMERQSPPPPVPYILHITRNIVFDFQGEVDF